MKTIIFFALLALSLAFIPQPSFLDLSHDNLVSDISDNTKENSLNQLMNERPRLQRQNAIRFPLSDSEDQDGLETSDSDTFQVDQTYFQGLNGSFTDIYNQWKKEDEEREAKGLNVAQDEEIGEKNPIKESFDKAENVFGEIFDEILGALQELSKEAEEKKTILGVDKASFKGTFESAKTDFDKVFDQALVGLSQLYNKPESSFFGVDKESVKEGLVELEGNVDEIFDETLSALTDLGREAVEKNTIFGFGKDDIKKFFGQSEESFEKILKEFPIDFAGLLYKDVEVKEAVNPDIATDETDLDNASTRESLSDDDVDLDEILLAVRNLFSETVEDNALFNTKVNSDSSDSFDVDHTYFNGLDSNFNQDLANKLVGDKEVNFDELLTVLGGLVNAAMEKGSEQSQE